MPQLVQSYIIYGKPVASANNKQVAINYATGRPYMHASHELREWFDSAIEQITEQIKALGHDTEAEIIESKKTKFVKRKGKVAQKEVTTYRTKHHNPVFQKKMFPDGYQVTVYFYHALQMDKRDAKTGEVKYKADGVTPFRQHYEPDTDGVVKGVKDALERAGVLDNDRNVKEDYCRDMAILPYNSRPFLSVIVQECGAPIPQPVLPVDLAVHMPRIFDAQSDWVETKAREQAYQELQARGGVALPPPQSKIRCARCHCFIGLGHVEQEIWVHYGDERWRETRWQNEVVLICGDCAERRFKYEDLAAQAQVIEKTLSVINRANNWSLTEAPTDQTTVEFGKFLNARVLVAEYLWQRYREEFCIVSSDAIGEIPLFSKSEEKPGIEQLRLLAQEKRFHDSGTKDSREGPKHRTKTNSGRTAASIRRLSLVDGTVQQPGEPSAELSDREQGAESTPEYISGFGAFVQQRRVRA